MGQIVTITDEQIEKVIQKMKEDGLFDKLNKKRKIYKVGLFLLLIVFIILIYFFKDLVVLLVFGYIIIFALVSSFFSGKFKKAFAKDYLSMIDEKFDYSPDNRYFPISFDEFFKESNIMDYYEGIDFEEDFIKFEGDGFKLYGEEVETYKITRDDKGNPEKEVVNHSYIFLVDILDHRFPIKESVKLTPDINDSKLKYLVYLGVILGVNAFGLVTLLFIFKNINNNILILISVLLTVFAIFLVKYFLSKDRVKLENQEFEKIFDVQSKDEVEARRLLTPKMMEKLVELVKQSGMRGWAFNFKDNKIYSKFNVGKFMEVGLFGKGLEDQIRDFLRQIKLVIDFVNYLNIEYFSEKEFLKERN